MHCVCEHVIGCNWSLTNSTHCYTLETTPEWNALTYTQVNAWFRTALKCPGGYIATANTVDTWHYGYCGYIVTVETVDTLPLGRQRSGTMVTCVCCSQPNLTFLAFCSWRKKMLTSGADISHFFKTEEKNHNADISRFLKRKKIQCWHLELTLLVEEKNGITDIWGLFLGGNRFKLGDTIGDWLSILTRSPNFLCFILWLFFSKTDNQLWIMESGCLLIMPLPTRKNGFEFGGFELLASKACYLSASLLCQLVNLWGCESIRFWVVATLNPGNEL